MHEQLTTFETANLAKEKGFYRISERAYNSEGKIEPIIGFIEHYCDAPTQSLLQKWLREVHQVDICISVLLKGIDGDATGYFYVIYKNFKEVYDWQERYGDVLEASEQDITGNYVNQELYNRLLFEMKFAFHTYEECLEYSLLEALKLIK